MMKKESTERLKSEAINDTTESYDKDELDKKLQVLLEGIRVKNLDSIRETISWLESLHLNNDKFLYELKKSIVAFDYNNATQVVLTWIVDNAKSKEDL